MEIDPKENNVRPPSASKKSESAQLARDRTERELHEAKEALHQSNQRVTNILESITDGFTAVDKQWRFIYVNRRAEEMFRPLHPSRQKLIGVSLWDAFPDIIGTPVEQHLRRAMQERVTVHYETEYVPLSAWFDVRVYPSSEGISIYFQDITQRKRAEDDSRQHQEWFRVTLASIGDAVVTTDISGRVTFLNPVAESMTGWTTQEAAGLQLEELFKIVDERTGEPLPNPVLKVLRDRVKVGLANHATLLTRHGKELAIEDSAAPIRNADGHLVGAVMVFHDVTDRRRAEAALRDSEERLRAIFHQAAVGIALAELDGRFINVNQRFTEILGYSPEELQKLTFVDLTHPDDLQRTHAQVSRLLSGESMELVYEKRFVRKDGTPVWCLTSVTLLRDAEARPQRFIGVVEDITQRKQAEEALRRSEEELRALNHSGTLIASNLDLHSLVQTVTDSATQLCGAKFGAFFYNVINEQGEAFLLYTLSGAPREAFEKFGLPRNTPVFNPTFRGECTVRSGDITKDPRYGKMSPYHGMPKGHLPVCSYLAVPVISRTGEVIGGLFFGHPEPDVFTERAERLVVGVAAQAAIAIDNARLYDAAQREIAERKRAEKALRESERKLAEANAELDRKVQERTASLQQAISQMEEFSYSVSHDLRAPLRAIDAYSRILASEFSAQIPSGAADFLQKITRNTARMDRLINDLLALSRVARSELHLQPIELQPLIAEVVEQHLEMQQPNADIQIQTNATVIGDEIYLSQAITNLLTNAIKFVAPGIKPAVTITSEQLGGRVRLWIADNGIGIRPEYQSKLFGMFERLHPDQQYEGTGIGLAIVRKAVERMGGAVGVESDGTQGSRFWIELPIAHPA